MTAINNKPPSKSSTALEGFQLKIAPNLLKNRIYELRQEKNLTQKQLATAVCTTEDSIYSWEKGRAEPSVEGLIRLAKFFDVSVDYLLGITDEYGNKIE